MYPQADVNIVEELQATILKEAAADPTGGGETEVLDSDSDSDSET